MQNVFLELSEFNFEALLAYSYVNTRKGKLYSEGFSANCILLAIHSVSRCLCGLSIQFLLGLVRSVISGRLLLLG